MLRAAARTSASVLTATPLMTTVQMSPSPIALTVSDGRSHAAHATKAEITSADRTVAKVAHRSSAFHPNLPRQFSTYCGRWRFTTNSADVQPPTRSNSLGLCRRSSYLRGDPALAASARNRWLGRAAVFRHAYLWRAGCHAVVAPSWRRVVRFGPTT